VSIIDELLSVQERDCRIREIQKEMTDIPMRQEQEQDRLEIHKKELADAEEAHKLSQAQAKELELETESRKEKIMKLRQQQATIKTNKEFSAIESEVASIQREISLLEDKELGLMENIEAASQSVAEKEAALKQEQAMVERDVQSLGERVSSLGVELKDVQEARTVAAKEVEPEWLQEYDRMIIRRAKALVAVENGICTGCHMQVPPAVAHDARNPAIMTACSHCGRLLY
jgi:predicted  nucleic acid-binding Zn-ribbon protein